MLRLRWPENPKVVQQGDALRLSLVLENVGPQPVEFKDAFLVLFGRLLDDSDREIATDGHRLGREVPLISYRIAPGETETVSVGLTLSPDDERSLEVGRYTVVIPLGDGRDEFANSVLTSTGAEPPMPLTVVIRSAQPQ